MTILWPLLHPLGAPVAPPWHPNAPICRQNVAQMSPFLDFGGLEGASLQMGFYLGGAGPAQIEIHWQKTKEN